MRNKSHRCRILFRSKIQLFVEKWLSYAEEHSEEDLFFPFFCDYLAFNYLYSVDGGRFGHERKKMLAYVNRKLDNLEERGCPFVLPDAIPNLRNGEVAYLGNDGRWARENQIIFQRDMTSEQIVDEGRRHVLLIFWRIYQVRCNLFHGAKHVNDARDRDLVRESTLVLGCFLKTLVKNHEVPIVMTAE